MQGVEEVGGLGSDIQVFLKKHWDGKLPEQWATASKKSPGLKNVNVGDLHGMIVLHALCALYGREIRVYCVNKRKFVQTIYSDDGVGDVVYFLYELSTGQFLPLVPDSPTAFDDDDEVPQLPDLLPEPPMTLNQWINDRLNLRRVPAAIGGACVFNSIGFAVSGLDARSHADELTVRNAIGQKIVALQQEEDGVPEWLTAAWQEDVLAGVLEQEDFMAENVNDLTTYAQSLQQLNSRTWGAVTALKVATCLYQVDIQILEAYERDDALCTLRWVDRLNAGDVGEAALGTIFIVRMIPLEQLLAGAHYEPLAVPNLPDARLVQQQIFGMFAAHNIFVAGNDNFGDRVKYP